MLPPSSKGSLRKFLHKEVLKGRVKSPGDGTREKQLVAELRSMFDSGSSFSDVNTTKSATQQEFESLFGEPIESEKHLTPLERFIKRTDSVKDELPPRPINHALETLRADLNELLICKPTTYREHSLIKRQRGALIDEIQRLEALEILDQKAKIKKNYTDGTLPEPIRRRDKTILMNRTRRLAKSRQGDDQDPKANLKRKRAKEEADEELAMLDGEDLLNLHSRIPKHVKKRPRYQAFKLEEVGTNYQDIKDMYNAASRRTLGRFQASLVDETHDPGELKSTAKDIGKELRAFQRGIERAEKKHIEEVKKAEEKRRIAEERMMEGRRGALFAKLKKGSRL